jgi:hypothetical protein
LISVRLDAWQNVAAGRAGPIAEITWIGALAVYGIYYLSVNDLSFYGGLKLFNDLYSPTAPR